MIRLSFLVSALVVLAISLLTNAAHAQPRRPDYCAIPGGTASLLLIDRTSPYTTSGEDHEGERIAAGIDTLLRSLRTADRLTVATIERHRRLSVLAFDECLPGCDPHNTSPIPLLNNCPEPTIARERNAYRRALFGAVIPLLENSTDQPNSDITGTIFQTVNQHRFAHIYIYSDMLENSQVVPWGVFSTQPAQRSFAAVQRSGFVPVLRSTQIQVVGYGLSHDRNHTALTDQQDRTIREFWDLYFGAAGATVTYRTAISP